MSKLDFLRLSLGYHVLQIVVLTAVFIACFRSFFGGLLNKYSTPLELEVNSNRWGLAIDWPNKQVYLCESRNVMAYDITSGNTRKLYTTDSACNDLAVDPYSR